MNQPLATIQNALKSGKLSGSWLITGADDDARRDFLKQIFELIFHTSFPDVTLFHPNIKWLECGLTEEAKKEIQKNILAGKSVDEKADYAHKHEITVDEVREGLKFLSLKSAEDEWRVLVIHPADKMNQSAANAFLKMLEEPPQNALILLLVENTGRLLPTIKSRCRKIILRSLTAAEIAQKLRDKHPDVTEADEIAVLSGGSYDFAEMIYTHQGIELYHQMTSFFVPVDHLSVKEMKDFISALSDEELALVQKFMIDWLVKKAKENALVNPFYTEDLIETYQTILRLFSDIDRIYLDKKQVLQTAFHQIAEVLHD